MVLISNNKMLFHFKIFFEEDETHKKKINSYFNGRMTFYGNPGFFHLFTPSNIINDQDRILIYFRKKQFKIVQSWLFAVISIYKYHINRVKPVEQCWQSIVKITID